MNDVMVGEIHENPHSDCGGNFGSDAFRFHFISSNIFDF